MRRIIYLAIIMINLVIYTNCSNGNSGGHDIGFIEPDFGSTFTWATTKEYTNLAGETCSGDNCISIYINRDIAGVTYNGFAVRNDDNSFNIKIYSSDGGATYSVTLKDGTNLASCTGQLATDIFTGTITVDTTNFFASATFTNNSICSSAYTYGGSTIIAQSYSD